LQQGEGALATSARRDVSPLLGATSPSGGVRCARNYGKIEGMKNRLLFAAAFAEAEALADPKLAPALEAALRRPGVMGHAAKSVDELAPGGGYKILPEVREGLCV